MDADFLIKAGGFILVVVAQVVVIARLVSRHGFKIEQIEGKIDNLNHALFPNGKPAFIYKDDCKGCHRDICEVINKGMAELKADTVKYMAELKSEFNKTDEAGVKAHANLHSRIDEIAKAVILLQVKNEK